MKFSPLIFNLFIISGITPIITLGMTLSMSSHVYAVEKNNHDDADYHQVSLNDVSSGTLLFKQSNSKRFLQAPQLKTQVEIEINGLVANVKVKQKFTNTSNNWQHGVYAFPLPDNAAINQLSMRVGDRVIIGEIQEKKQARKTFNNAKKSGKKAALIEQYRPNLFTTQLANIPPNEEVEVELSYFQQVDYQAGEFSLHFPMAITPRYQPKGSKTSATHNLLPTLIFQARAESRAEKHSNTSSFEQYSTTDPVQGQFIDVTVDLFSGAELEQVNSINHSLIAEQQELGHYRLKLVNQLIEKDFKLTWQYQPQALPQILNFQQTYQNKKYGLLMVLPGLSELNENSAANKITPLRELTFVLDTSGSMAGDSLAQAKQAFKYALTSLHEHDSFQLIAFNSYPTKLFQAPVLASETNKQQAWRFVSALESTGGTEIKSALDLVLNEKLTAKNSKNEKLQQIVFLTDGAVGNEAEIFSDIAKKIGSKRLFTVGLGTAPNRYFMKKAAEIGRGSYQFISNHNELVKQMDRLFTKLSQPVLTDLNMSLNNPNGVLVTTPNPIPDVYANEPLFLSYQVTGEQSDSLLTGIYQGEIWSINIENYQQENVDANFLGSLEGNKTVSTKATEELNIPPLATLWARRKIADHYRQLMLYKESKAKDNIIELALKYHLVTPFTSLVAVEKEVSRPHHQTANAKQLKNMLPAGQKLPSTALNWQWQFNGAICLLLMSVISLLLIPQRKNND
ncbi:marine proteobacterial sortase target protein [Colwellia sp. 12G3]|uniref:marine proteobacterial sortase target protein n=1 Tax=Colwellia sp. 12G3 TaxID=2058299 RepID=UPI000C33AC26|nr:marine proteobacterial sortase target protein [Colwellia sp. 12G3]PKI12636.1 marine proteobacterial sortase target protein [Colwellia sp. 12G3]